MLLGGMSMSPQSVRFRIVSRSDWSRRRAVGSKFDGVIDAALKLKDDKKVVSVLSGGMKFDTLSIGLRSRIDNRKLRKRIHVEQNKQTKKIVIVKGPSLVKETGRGRSKRARSAQKEGRTEQKKQQEPERRLA